VSDRDDWARHDQHQGWLMRHGAHWNDPRHATFERAYEEDRAEAETINDARKEG